MKKWFKIIGDEGVRPSSFVCYIHDCYFKRECANHVTAGDFREDGGDSPELQIINGHVCCSKTIEKEGYGFVAVDEDGHKKYQAFEC